MNLKLRKGKGAASEREEAKLRIRDHIDFRDIVHTVVCLTAFLHSLLLDVFFFVGQVL